MFRFEWLTPRSDPRETIIEIHLRIAQIPDAPNRRTIVVFAGMELTRQHAPLQEAPLG